MWTYTSIPYLAAWKSAARILLASAIWARNLKKCPFTLSSHSIRNHRQKHVACAGSCLISTLWTCFALCIRTNLKLHRFLQQSSPFPAHWGPPFSLQGRVQWKFPTRVLLWFLTAAQENCETMRWDEMRWVPWKKGNTPLKGFACDIDWEMFPFKLAEMQNCCA